MHRSCEAQVEIAAPPAAVWAVATDVTRVGEWSGECLGCEWVDGATHASVGARFVGRNRRSGIRWTRTNQVFVADAPTRFVWRTMPGGVFPDSVEWAIDLEEHGSGTTAHLSFSVIKLPKAMEFMIGLVMPTHRDRTEDLTGDLGRLKALVENAPVAESAG